MLTAKVTLNTAQRTRDLENELLNIVLEDSSPVVLEMAAAGVQYSKEVEGKTPDQHQKGPPHIHKFAALMEALDTEAKKLPEQGPVEPVMQVAATTIIKMNEAWAGLDLWQANDLVRICKVRSCIDKKGRSKSSRIIFALGALPADIASTTGMTQQSMKEGLRYFLNKQMGAQVDIGAPVASLAEAKLSKKVEAITKQK